MKIIVKAWERKRNSCKKRRETSETGLDLTEKRKGKTQKRNAKEKTVQTGPIQCAEHNKHIICFVSLKQFLDLKFKVQGKPK